MGFMKTIAAFLRKYSHVWILSYGLIYLTWFCYLERTVTRNYHVMHVAMDDYIPFNEYFIVPYLMWFLYVAVTILYFLFTVNNVMDPGSSLHTYRWIYDDYIYTPTLW